MAAEDYYSYIRKFFKQWAPFYDIVNIFISGVRNTVVDFTDARKGSRILDIATGTGKQAFAFAERGYDVTGIDLSEDMLKIANSKNKYENVMFKVADAADIPFEDKHFDVSCVSFALHDMPMTAIEILYLVEVSLRRYNVRLSCQSHNRYATFDSSQRPGHAFGRSNVCSGQ